MTPIYADRDVLPGEFQSRGVAIAQMYVDHIADGPFAGVAAVFVSVAGCNRGAKLAPGCDWCTAKFHVVNPNGVYTNERTVVDVKLLALEDSKLGRGVKIDTVVLSGGEPMLQDSLPYLVQALENASFRVIVESNGDRLAHHFAVISGCASAYLIVSPRVERSGKYATIAEDVLSRADYFKVMIGIVPGDERDSYYTLPPQLESETYREKVFVCPIILPLSAKATRANCALAKHVAFTHAVRLTISQNVLLELQG